tara:strand:- start:302419 stop:302724 length:306 start_codon:yes stop_codon:yes gene_type:complete
MNYFILIFILGVGTFLIRTSFILLGHKISIHHNIKVALSFLTITLLPAMIFPKIILLNPTPTELNERLAASIVALFISYQSKNVLITMLGGFLSLVFFKSL